jgi:hypothetical protein
VADSVQQHAVDNLRFIRDAMERAGSFTAIPGWGQFAIGVTAVATATVAQRLLWSDPAAWLLAWLLEAVLAAIIAVVTTLVKAKRANHSLTAGPARRFYVSYAAPLAAGAVLTVILALRGIFVLLPGVWLLLQGTAFASSGAFSIRLIPVMGICFMLLALPTFFAPLPIANLLLGVGFGGLHMLFGYLIGRSYGG